MNKQEIGKTYGKLTILNFETPVVYNNKDGSITKRNIVSCQCVCGNAWKGILNSLKNGKTTSCGCFNKTLVIKRNKNKSKHNLSKTPEHMAWRAMKARCLNPKNPSYKNYGERGITICEEWVNSFEEFYKNMGAKPSKIHSINRVNNEGNYCHSNCIWSTPKEQANNRRKRKKSI